VDQLPSIRPETRVRIPQHIVYREFPAQTAMLNLRTGKYHGLNPTAGRMLGELDRGTIAAAANAFAVRYEQPRATVERDLCELCARLLERGLVEIVAGGGVTAS
jgi:hypothetical protein